MRARDNYYAEIEQAVAPLLADVRYQGGPLSHQSVALIASQLGFSVHHVHDLPQSTRSVTDTKNGKIYVPLAGTGTHDPRAVVLQTLGHFVLGHADPTSYGDFLRQRVEANYFAAAVLMPEDEAVAFLLGMKSERDIAIEDLRDLFAVSYETAAHRFTNLVTHHLGLPVHLSRGDASGRIYKAYENDGLQFPVDVTGAIEGQVSCRAWAARTVFAAPDKFSAFAQYTDTPAGTFWCVAQAEQTPGGEFAINIGVPYVHAKWFRGRGHHAPHDVDVSGHVLLPAAAARADGAVARPCVALREGTFPHARRDAVGDVPRCG